MRYVSLAVMTMVVLAAQVSRAQRIPLSLAEAYAEGAAFPHAAVPLVVQPLFAGPFGGTSERMCTSQPNEPIPGGSLRSGDIIIRSRLTGRWGLHAGQGHKILWMPLHGPADTSTKMSFADWRNKAVEHAPLLIRAVRLGVGYPTTHCVRRSSA